MKLRIAAIAVSIICLLSFLSVSCLAAEMQAPSVKSPTEPVVASVTTESTLAETQAPTISEYYYSTEDEPLTEPSSEIATAEPETLNGSEEPEGPDTGKAFIIGLCCIFVGGLIACGIIYYKKKNDDGSDDE